MVDLYTPYNIPNIIIPFISWFAYITRESNPHGLTSFPRFHGKTRAPTSWRPLPNDRCTFRRCRVHLEREWETTTFGGGVEHGVFFLGPPLKGAWFLELENTLWFGDDFQWMMYISYMLYPVNFGEMDECGKKMKNQLQLYCKMVFIIKSISSPSSSSSSSSLLGIWMVLSIRSSMMAWILELIDCQLIGGFNHLKNISWNGNISSSRVES